MVMQITYILTEKIKSLVFSKNQANNWVCPVVRGSLLQPDIFINKMIVFYKSTLK